MTFIVGHGLSLRVSAHVKNIPFDASQRSHDQIGLSLPITGSSPSRLFLKPSIADVEKYERNVGITSQKGTPINGIPRRYIDITIKKGLEDAYRVFSQFFDSGIQGIKFFHNGAYRVVGGEASNHVKSLLRSHDGTLINRSTEVDTFDQNFVTSVYEINGELFHIIYEKQENQLPELNPQDVLSDKLV